jgi:protease-4
MVRDQVEALADGRIFTGEESQTLGLVDRLGNMQDAIEWAGRLGGITGDIETVYAREKKLTFLEFLLMDTRLKSLLEKYLNPGVRAEYRYDPAR